MNTLSFLNQPLLWGLTAASIPLIIHLLFRRRYRRIDWAPMHYLKLSIQRNRRRIRLEQLLLLLMRMAAMLLLFFMIARPVMHASGLGSWLGGGGRRSQLIVIDDSASMAYRVEGRAAFDRAKELVTRVLETVQPKDRLTLLVASHPKEPLVREVEMSAALGATSLVDKLRVSDVHAAWEPVLNAVDELQASGTYPISEITLITDLRRAGWEGKLVELGERWQASGVRMRVFDVGSASTNDSEIVALEPKDPIALAGTPTSWDAVIRNNSGAALPERDATFEIDGKPSIVRLPGLAAGETVRVPVSAVFQQPGQHHIVLRLPDDDFPSDDVATAVVDVRPELHMVLVDGEPSTDPQGGEVDFLALALSLGVAQGEAFRIEVASETDWPGTLQARPDLLVLANIASITPDQVELLEQHVTDGMGLMVFLGELVEIDAYNQRLWRDGAGVLPVPLETISDAETTGLLLDGGTPGALDALAQLKAAVLERVRTRKHFQVQTPADDAKEVRVLARWNDASASPAVIEKRFGAGHVLLWTVTADKAWSDWPTEPSYVLAVREAARAVARGDAGQRALAAGQPLRWSLRPGEEARNPVVEGPAAGTPQAARLELLGDAGVPATDRPKALSYADTRSAGLYRLNWRDAKDAQRSESFAVNADRREADLQRIESSAVREAFGSLEPEVIAAAGADQSIIAVAGQEIWRKLAAGLLGLLACEACFATWAGRQH